MIRAVSRNMVAVDLSGAVEKVAPACRDPAAAGTAHWCYDEAGIFLLGRDRCGAHDWAGRGAAGVTDAPRMP